MCINAHIGVGGNDFSLTPPKSLRAKVRSELYRTENSSSLSKREKLGNQHPF